MGIIAVGSIAIDSIKTPKGEKRDILGGSLSHFSLATSFITRSKLISVVGNDFPNDYWDFLSQYSIILGIKVDFKGKTFRWEGYYTEDFLDVVTTKTELNCFENFEPEIPPIYKKRRKDILFLANIDPVLQKNVLKELEFLPLKVLDTMEYWIKSRRQEVEELIGMVDGIIINESESFMLTGEKNIFCAIEKLFKCNLKFIVLKRGPNGVMVFFGDEIITLPAFPVKDVVDPTGAGDSFAGGFLSYLDSVGVHKLTLEKMKKAAVFATIVSSFVVEDFGVEGLLKVEEKDIKERFRLYRKMVCF